jgi:hypothetical protein
MRISGRPFTAIFLAASLLGAVGCARTAPQEPASAAPSSPSDMGQSNLYVISALSGTSSRSASGAYEVSLIDVSRSVTVFADRPSRSASTENIGSFVQKWSEYFGSDPPNAALVMHDETEGSRIAAVEIVAPRYDASSNVLGLAVKVLPPRRQGHISELPQSFGRSELFVDPSGQASSSGRQLGQWPSNQVTVTFSNVPAQSFTGVEISGFGDSGGWIMQMAEAGGDRKSSLPISLLNVDSNALLFLTSENAETLKFEMWICSSSDTVQVVPQEFPSGAKITMDAGAGELTITGPGTYNLKIANPQSC